MGGLRFDRRLPDRGYAYVGTSRFKRRADIWHIGHICRTDWLPVGGDQDNAEQHYPGVDSSSSGGELEDDDEEQLDADDDDHDERDAHIPSDDDDDDSDRHSCDFARMQARPDAQREDVSYLFD